MAEVTGLERIQAFHLNLFYTSVYPQHFFALAFCSVTFPLLKHSARDALTLSSYLLPDFSFFYNVAKNWQNLDVFTSKMRF